MSEDPLLEMLREVIEEIADSPGRYETSYERELRYRNARRELRNALIRLCAADRENERG